MYLWHLHFSLSLFFTCCCCSSRITNHFQSHSLNIMEYASAPIPLPTGSLYIHCCVYKHVLFRRTQDNLFPYAAKNVESFLDSHWDEDEIKEAVKMLRDQSEVDKKEEMDGCVAIVAESEEKAKQIESIVANVKWQMEHDRKAGPLKNLQGIMWVDAYKAGAFKGQ